MSADRLWSIAAGVERCALGWAQDARRYRGRRREIRLERADALRARAEQLMVRACGEGGSDE